MVCDGAGVHRFEPPMGLEAILVVPHEAVRTEAARAALPAEVPMADAVFNLAHVAMLVRGLTADWDLIAAGLDDRLHQPRRAHLYPRSAELLERAPRPRRARRHDLRRRSGGARVVALRANGRVMEALARETERLGDR